ncbi:hypothetical protein NC651_028782 [Populus alba x Populus x berolinensis]|nr:hypothetical protein NC651_028782 [Populus alba x Populus x berolinensis]
MAKPLKTGRRSKARQTSASNPNRVATLRYLICHLKYRLVGFRSHRAIQPANIMIISTLRRARRMAFAMAAISDLYFFSLKGIPYIKNIAQFTFKTISRLYIAPPPLTSATHLHGDFVMVVKCNPDSTAV